MASAQPSDMIIRQLLGVSSIGAVAFFCMLSSAHAQTPRAGGPFARLFGAPSSATHSLDFHGSLFGAYQEVFVPPEAFAAGVLDPQFQRTGTFTGAAGTLDYIYGRHGEHSSFDVAGHGGLGVYSLNPRDPQYTATASVGAGHFGNITQKITYAVSGAASYSPYYSYQPFSPDTIGSSGSNFVGPQFGFGSALSTTLPVTGTAQITDHLSRRDTLSGTVEYLHLFEFSDASMGSQSLTGRVLYNRQLFRTLGVYVGYQWATYQYSGSDQGGVTQGIDAGFNYGDALTIPLGRHTTASFSGAVTGARAVGSPAHYYLTGSAEIDHTMGRTWTTSAAYHRSYGFMSLFTQPVLQDSVVGSLSGLLAPRVSSTSSVGWTHGYVGANGASNTLNARYASSNLTYGVARRVGLYAQYLYYQYLIPVGPFTTFAVPSNSSRQTASVGVTFWVPIYNNARTRRDTR